MAAPRLIIVLAIAALMLVGATASKMHGHSGKLSQCNRTFPGCKTCTGTYGEADYSCEACRNSITTVFDDQVYKACICNSADGYGALPWPTGGKVGRGCVLCSKYKDAAGLALVATGPFCVAGSGQDNGGDEEP